MIVKLGSRFGMFVFLLAAGCGGSTGAVSASVDSPDASTEASVIGDPNPNQSAGNDASLEAQDVSVSDDASVDDATNDIVSDDVYDSTFIDSNTNDVVVDVNDDVWLTDSAADSGACQVNYTKCVMLCGDSGCDSCKLRCVEKLRECEDTNRCGE